jgi:VanZ family protein
MGLIFWMSSDATPPAIAPFEIPDKVSHVVLYAPLGLLVARALAGGWQVQTLSTVFAAGAIATLYGVTDEVHQHFVPPREVEALDVVADAVGATAGAAFLYVQARRAITRDR